MARFDGTAELTAEEKAHVDAVTERAVRVAMAATVREFIMTVGIQYTGDEATGWIHPLGLTAAGYTVIEAPSYELARSIAGTITDREFSGVYEHVAADRLAFYHPDGEQLRIAWVTPTTDAPKELRRSADVTSVLEEQADAA